MSKVLIKENEHCQVFQKGDVFTLRYFDEIKGHPKYNRNKPVKLSRVTKNVDFINRVLEAM